MDITQNKLLAAIPNDEMDTLEPSIQTVSLGARQLLFDFSDTIAYVYFPLTCAISMINVLRDGSSVEVAIVAGEGIAGLTIFHGSKKSFGRAIVQVPGEAVRINADIFKTLKGRLPCFTDWVLRYTDVFFHQTFTSTGCNHFHSVEQRIARWLIDHCDRYPGEVKTFPFTHDFLAEMLGANRSTVSQITDKMQKQGLIQYNRGRMAVVDKPGLAAVACECYGLVKEALDEFVDDLRHGRMHH